MTRFASLAQHARTQPDRPALYIAQDGENRTISYGDLAQRVRQSRRGLAGLGVGRSDVVAVLLDNGLAYAELLHAIALRGAVLLPLNTRLTPAEISFQLKESGAKCLVSGPGRLQKLAVASLDLVGGRAAIVHVTAGEGAAPVLASHAHGCGSQSFGSAVEEFGSAVEESGSAVEDADREATGYGNDRDEPDGFDDPDDPNDPSDPDSTLILIYTSGTTGRPKGVMLPHRSFYWSALGSAAHLGVESNDRWLACLPLFHVGGLSILLRSALYGTAVIVHPGFDPQAVNRALDEEGVTLVSLVPTMLSRLLDARGERKAPSSLRCLLLGGAGAPRGLLERARALGFPVACTYGLTEAASQVATQSLDPGQAKGSDGLRALPGTSLQVVNSAGRAVRGEPGEIWVRGRTLMRGYLDRPDELSLCGGWLHTGDIGVQNDAGELRILDRRSDLIVSGGENIYPAEIEAVLLDHPAVSEAAVSGREDREYGRRPAAWLVREPGRVVDAEELRRFCATRLARYKIPVAFAFVDALPRNASGKLLRRRLGSQPSPA